MRSDALLPWLTSESRLSVSGCWSIPLRANFLLLACLYNLIDSTQDIEVWSSSLGWCVQASSTLGTAPHMTLPDIWNHLTNQPENPEKKADFWDVGSAAGWNQSKPKERMRVVGSERQKQLETALLVHLGRVIVLKMRKEAAKTSKQSIESYTLIIGRTFWMSILRCLIKGFILL